MAFTIQNTAEATYLALTRITHTDIDILVSAMSGAAKVITGCTVTAQGTPDGTVAVAAGSIASSGVTVAVSAGNVNVLSGAGSTAAHATLDRIDLIHADLTSGAKAVTAGTAAAAATVLPPLVPAGKIGLAFIYVPANDTTIQTDQIAQKDTKVGLMREVNTLTGGAISEVVTHNLNTRDLSAVTVINNASPYDQVEVTWEATTVDTVTVRAGSVLPAGYKVVISA
jgi:hypothetical protein